MRTNSLAVAALAVTVSAVTLETDTTAEASFDIDNLFGNFFESIETPSTYTPPSAVYDTPTYNNDFLNDYLYGKEISFALPEYVHPDFEYSGP